MPTCSFKAKLSKASYVSASGSVVLAEAEATELACTDKDSAFTSSAGKVFCTETCLGSRSLIAARLLTLLMASMKGLRHATWLELPAAKTSSCLCSAVCRGRHLLQL